MIQKSFSQRLKEGWTKERLMKHFALTETQYNKILKSLEDIKKKQEAKP